MPRSLFEQAENSKHVYDADRNTWSWLPLVNTTNTLNNPRPVNKWSGKGVCYTFKIIQ